MKKRIFCLLMLALLLCGLLPLRTAAVTLDPSMPCSLTLHYDSEGGAFPGLEIEIHRFAELHANLTFDLVAPYSAFPVYIYGITTQQEWDNVAHTLSAYIAADNVQPTRTETTDENGTVCFTGLQSGLYLVNTVHAENYDGAYVFDAFVIMVPGAYDNDYHYEVEANPKCGEFVPATEYTVMKLWTDGENTNRRPDSIVVDIFRDDVFQEEVVLNGDNNWVYTWKVAPGDTAIWTVAEKYIPEGYRVTIEKNTFIFTLNNTFVEEEPDYPPQTGDSFSGLPWIMAMGLSGCLLILLGTYRKRFA